MDYEAWKQRREEMFREAERSRLAKKLRDTRKRRGSGQASGRYSGLVWELKRGMGRIGKLLKSVKKHG